MAAVKPCLASSAAQLSWLGTPARSAPPSAHPSLALALHPRRPQNLALNVAEKGFPISVYNRSSEKTDAAVARAGKEGVADRLHGFKDIKEFVASLERPRWVPALPCTPAAGREQPVGLAAAQPSLLGLATVGHTHQPVCRSAHPRCRGACAHYAPPRPARPAQARDHPGQGGRPRGCHRC